jgi:HEAT repeat protein
MPSVQAASSALPCLRRCFAAGGLVTALWLISVAARAADEPKANLAALKKATKDAQPAVRAQAARELGKLGHRIDEEGIQSLSALLKDTTPKVRLEAALAVAALCSSATAHPPALEVALKRLFDVLRVEKDDPTRRAVLSAVAALMDSDHRDHAAVLYRLLSHRDVETARGAAYALANMGGAQAKRAVPVLKKALGSNDAAAQTRAALSLANVGQDAADAVDDLVKALKGSKNATVRRNCCVAIGRLKTHGKPAVPALAEAIKSGPSRDRQAEEVRELAAEAIAQIRFPHNEAAMATVRSAIATDTNQLVRQYCVWATFNVRDLDKYSLVKPLTKVLDETADESLLVRYDAARSLAAALSEKAPDKTIDALLHMLENKSLKVFNKTDGTPSGVASDLGGDARYMAAQALGWLGDKAKNNQKVVNALRKATKDKDEKLKSEAEKALKNLTGR